jgi:hypothetical protein
MPFNKPPAAIDPVGKVWKSGSQALQQGVTLNVGEMDVKRQQQALVPVTMPTIH